MVSALIFIPSRPVASRGQQPGNPRLVFPSGWQLLPDVRQRQDPEAVEPAAGDAAADVQRPRLRGAGRGRVSRGQAGKGALRRGPQVDADLPSPAL